MAYNPDYLNIATQFIQYFYTRLDSKSFGIGFEGFYDEQNSFLTFEGAQLRGRRDIMEKTEVGIAGVIIPAASCEQVPLI